MPGILTDDGVLDPALFNRNPPVAGVSKVKNLAQDLNEVVTRVINNDIPPEHKRSHTKLRRILRGTSHEHASNYDQEKEIITINVPFKWKGDFLRKSKTACDKWLVRLASSKTTDKGSFLAKSPATRAAMRNDNMFEWVIRHEFGHSVDKLIQFTNRFAGDPLFGGWVRYPKNNPALLRDILIDLGVDTLLRSNALLQDPIFLRFTTLLAMDDGTWRTANVIQGLRQKVKVALQSVAPAMRGFWQGAHRLIHYAVDDPWLEGNQVQHTVVNGRRYLFNSDYKTWYSCSDSAFSNRISNYQFSSPSEWFAETYAAWRGAGTAFKDLLIPPGGANRNQDVVDWFNECLVDYGGLQSEDLIQNEGTPNAALREAPLPANLVGYENPYDLEVFVPASWHFKHGPNLIRGNKLAFNPRAVPFPN
jgi:hypothetical protein